MANDIFGSELNVDFSGILHQAEEFDNKLKDIDHTAKQLGHTLRNALGNLDLGGLKSLKDNIERLGESKISLKVVGAEELTKMSSTLDTLISQVDVFSKGGVSVFDSKALYSDNNNVLELSASLEKVDQKISKLKEAWKSIGTSEQLAASDELFKGFVSPTHKNGTEYKPESKTYQNAMREHLEAQARIAIEEKAILSESLNWAKMTEDEKAAYIQKKLNDIFKAEEQQAKRVRKEYSDTVNEMVSLMKQTDSLNKKNTDGSITPQVKQMEDRFTELNAKRVQLEQQYGEHVVDIAQKTNSKVLAIEANRILEKNKKEKEETEKWYSTATGARYKANTAHTIGEKEEAMGYLKTAMKNTYSPELMDELRNKYQELRIAVEEHKKALNGELSLQPTVRAEYMRLRKELDSVVESKEKLAKTQAYKSGDEVAKSDYNAMTAREEDIQAKIIQIRKNAQGQLDAVDREYESKRAQASVDVFTKAENQKTEIAKQRLRAQLAKSSKYGNISADSALRMIRVTDNASNVSQHEAAIRKLKDAINHLDESSFDYGATLDKLNQKIKAHEDAIRSASMTEAEYYKQIEANYQKEEGEYWKNQAKTSPNAILTYSKEADSINKQIKAIELLKIARDNLNKTAMGDTAYLAKVKELNEEIKRQQSEVDKLRGKQEQLKNSKKGLMDTMGQLQRKLALLFSVSAIQGYINKIVEVRKEFEYQQKSLQFLLQNKDAADKIWNESVALALKSPFRVKEIVTYTKQLAAYRIESDKLHDTTKRLADVASGIGVDMQRLILAYGQVRAAEFLRATELRQFTEAGIPLLEELANYYSVIEKKAVTTAEVFNRISKRQVLFADVEKVFKGLTSEGGMFYKMQEKQAETLHGQISNLHDQIDLMLNSIGNSNQRTIESFINMARGFISSWRTISDQIIMVGSVLTIARIAVIAFANANKLAKASTLAFNKGLSVNNKTLMLLSRQLKITQATAVGFSGVLRVGMVKASMAAVFAFQSLKAALTSFLPALVITAIMELVWWLAQADEKTREFAEAVSSIHSEVGKELHDSIDLYRRLAEVVGDLTNTETERVEALNKLKQVFGDILPDQYLEMKYVESLSGNYNEATEAMTEYYNSKVVSQKKAKVDEIYGGDITKNVTDLKEDFLDVLNDPKSAENIDNKWGEGTTELIKDGIGKAIEDATDAIKNGEFDATVEGFNQALEQSISKYTGKDISDLLSRVDLFKDGIDWETKGVVKNIQEVVDGVKDWKTAMSGIEGFPGETAKFEANKKEMEQYEKALEDVKDKVQELKNAFSDYNRLKNQKPADDATQEEKASYEKQKKEIEDKIKTVYGDLSIDIPVNFDVSTIAESTHLITQETNRVEQESMNMFSMVAKMGAVLDWAKPTAVAKEWTYLFKNVAKGFMEMSDSGEYTGRIIKKEMDGSTTVLYDFSDKLKGKDGVNNLLLQMGENAKKSADMLDPTQIQVYTNGVIDSALRAAGLSEGLLSNFRAKADDSMQSFTTNFHNTAENFIQTYNWISAQLAATPLRMDVVLANNGLTLEQWEQQKQVVPVIQSLLKEFPKYDDFKPEKNKGRKGGKKEDPAKDAADIVEQVWDRYNDLVQNMSSADAIEEVRKYFEKDFAKAMKDAKVALELKNFDFSQYDNIVAALEKIKDKAKGETAEEIGKTIGDLKVDKQKKENKDAAEARDREIDQLFEMYELYKELEKINIPTDWAKSFFNIDATSLTDLRSQLEANKYRFVGEEGKEEYQKYLDKLSEMEQKEQEERLKTYLQYARDAVGERAKIKLEELKKLSEIEQAFKPLETDTPEVKEQKEQAKEIATQKVKDESAQATKKLEWEEFQKSDTFMSLFEDLDNASTALMEHTLKKIRDFKNEWADMPLEDVKAMTDKINQLENAIELSKNPFTAVKNIRKKVEEETGQKLKSPEELDTEGAALDAENERLNKEIASLGVIRSLKSENKNLDEDQIKVLNNLKISTGATTDELDKQITTRKDALDQNNQAIQDVNKQKQANKDITKAYNSQADALKNIDKMANDLYDAFSEIWEVVGNDEMAKVWADMGMSLASSVFQATALIMQLTGAKTAAEAFGKAMNSAMGIVGLIVMAVQIVAQVLSAAFKAHDEGKQKEIDKEIKSIKRLEKELENLEEQLEAVYSLGGVNKSMRQVQANIDKQIQSYEKMMRLEEEKKSTDEDQIEEWKENIEELREKRKELHKEMVESLGGNYDVRSVAREFVDAWIDAFKETGDGLKGLRDNFKDFFLNILLEQAVMQKVGSFFSDAMDYLNNTVLSDYIVTDAERKQTEGMFDEAMIKTDDYLNLLFGENGVLNKYIDDTDSSLSGLQQGIQGVTEETAQIIEAYLNSIRFYIAQDNQNLAKLVDTFTNVESPNPILNELRTQTELITSIRDLFRDVVRMGHPTYGGAFLKVAL